MAFKKVGNELVMIDKLVENEEDFIEKDEEKVA